MNQPTQTNSHKWNYLCVSLLSQTRIQYRFLKISVFVTNHVKLITTDLCMYFHRPQRPGEATSPGKSGDGMDAAKLMDRPITFLGPNHFTRPTKVLN